MATQTPYFLDRGQNVLGLYTQFYLNNLKQPPLIVSDSLRLSLSIFNLKPVIFPSLHRHLSVATSPHIGCSRVRNFMLLWPLWNLSIAGKWGRGDLCTFLGDTFTTPPAATCGGVRSLLLNIPSFKPTKLRRAFAWPSELYVTCEKTSPSTQRGALFSHSSVRSSV